MPGPERVPGAVWPGTAAVGEDGSTYCLWSFPPGSALWDRLVARRCQVFSFAAPIHYANA